jgi:PLP dependent protein
MSVSTNIEKIRERIYEACNKSQRGPDNVNIVAVTKTVNATAISEAINAGVKIVGENRVQEAWNKFQTVEQSARWHMIGHLQTNKVKRALQFANVLESVDSLRLAEEINRRSQELNKPATVFLQVNTSFEESKFGLGPHNVVEFLKKIAEFEFLNVKGLMTVGAFLPDPENVRPCFSKLRDLRDQINDTNSNRFEIQYLSMGMTNDFEVAIEEGATHIRIGRAIFGER